MCICLSRQWWMWTVSNRKYLWLCLRHKVNYKHQKQRHDGEEKLSDVNPRNLQHPDLIMWWMKRGNRLPRALLFRTSTNFESVFAQDLLFNSIGHTLSSLDIQCLQHYPCVELNFFRWITIRFVIVIRWIHNLMCIWTNIGGAPVTVHLVLHQIFLCMHNHWHSVQGSFQQSPVWKHDHDEITAQDISIT